MKGRLPGHTIAQREWLKEWRAWLTYKRRRYAEGVVAAPNDPKSSTKLLLAQPARWLSSALVKPVEKMRSRPQCMMELSRFLAIDQVANIDARYSLVVQTGPSDDHED